MVENNNDQRLQFLLYTQGRSHKRYGEEIVVKYKQSFWENAQEKFWHCPGASFTISLLKNGNSQCNVYTLNSVFSLKMKKPPKKNTLYFPL